jgi:hypothetical protein
MALTAKQEETIARQAAKLAKEARLYEAKKRRDIAKTAAAEAETKKLQAIAKLRRAKSEASRLRFESATNTVKSAKGFLSQFSGSKSKKRKRR